MRSGHRLHRLTVMTWLRSALLTCWGNAWLRGHTSLEEAEERARGDDVAHHVIGLPDPTGDADSSEAQPLLVALSLLRRGGTTRMALAYPAPGDPTGLVGPREFNEAALEAGEAVVCDGSGLGLVPLPVGAGVQWQVHRADPPPPPSLPQAESDLAEALLETTTTLVDLDVARWRPEAAAALADLRRSGDHPADGLPPGYSPRAERVRTRAHKCLLACELALDDDGAAVSAHEVAARQNAFRPLERAARRAMIAACTDATG